VNGKIVETRCQSISWHYRCLCLNVVCPYTVELCCSKIQKIQNPGLLSVLALTPCTSERVDMLE
jgi:hypothetical protein